MAGQFGEAYYGGGASQLEWHWAEQFLENRLKPILDTLDIDARGRVEQTVRFWRRTVHRHLRDSTQLGKGAEAGMNITVTVSDKVPPPVVQILQALPEGLLWLLLNRGLIGATHRG